MSVCTKQNETKKDKLMSFPSEKQAETISNIIDGLINGQDSCLAGFAGSGKSTVVGAIIDVLENEYETPVVLTALTNKAARSLEEAIESGNGNKVSADTIHKFLSLKPFGREGGLVQRKTEEGPPAHKFRGVCIVDESSMLGSKGEKSLWSWIQKAKKVNPNIVFLYVGDVYQLPPINEEVAICFTEEANLQIFELTEIFRQAGSNPVVEIANRYRLAQNGDPLPRLEEWMNDKGEGLQFLSRLDFETAAKQSQGRARFLSYTNRGSIYYDNIIRTEMHPLHAPHIVTGEKLIANEPYIEMGSENILIGNCEEVEVINVTHGQVYETDFFDLKHSRVTVRTEAGNLVSTNVAIDELERKGYISKCYDEIYKMDKYKSRPTQEDQLAYQELKKARTILSGTFADLRYGFSSTVHKSQGESIDIVFVDLENINKMRNKMDILKSVYVAFTRARKRVYVCGDINRGFYS